MVDEAFILETPPLRAGWAKVGGQAEVPITGNPARRAIHGALNATTGHVELLISEEWTAATHQAFLRQVRQAWRGWHIGLSVDRGSPHTAKASRTLAAALGVEVRWLPTATPELNACEGLWRGAKGFGLANRASQSLEEAADAARRCLLGLAPRQRLQLADVLSGHFWLAA
jgi:DDE superfamily endonuclease